MDAGGDASPAQRSATWLLCSAGVFSQGASLSRVLLPGRRLHRRSAGVAARDRLQAGVSAPIAVRRIRVPWIPGGAVGPPESTALGSLLFHARERRRTTGVRQVP